MMGVVDGVNGVDGFHFLAGLTDVVHGAAHGQPVVQLDKLHRHQAAGRILWVVQKLPDAAARLAVDIAQHFFDDVGRYLLQEIHRVIQEEAVNHLGDLLVGYGVHNVLLRLCGQVGEYVGGKVLGEYTKDQQPPLRVQDLHERRNIHHVHFCQFHFEGSDLVVVDQLLKLLKTLHGIRSFLRDGGIFAHDKNTRHRKNSIARGMIQQANRR